MPVPPPMYNFGYSTGTIRNQEAKLNVPFTSISRKSAAVELLNVSMKQHKLSTGKRFTKPILFGTLIVGLATAFFNRHLFIEDIDAIREQERVRNNAKLNTVLERRQKQMEEMAEKRAKGSQ